MSANYDRLVKAHRLRSGVELLERGGLHQDLLDELYAAPAITAEEAAAVGAFLAALEPALIRRLHYRADEFEGKRLPLSTGNDGGPNA